MSMVQVELSNGSNSLLNKVMAAFARPTRLVSSQKIQSGQQVDAQLFEVEEEHRLREALQQVSTKVHIRAHSDFC